MTKRSVQSKACHGKCAGGHPCDCDGDTRHTLHICHRAECLCHMPQSIGLQADPVAGMYIPEGMRLVKVKGAVEA
jgi:hypothetical protein